MYHVGRCSLCNLIRNIWPSLANRTDSKKWACQNQPNSSAKNTNTATAAAQHSFSVCYVCVVGRWTSSNGISLPAARDYVQQTYTLRFGHFRRNVDRNQPQISFRIPSRFGALTIGVYEHEYVWHKGYGWDWGFWDVDEYHSTIRTYMVYLCRHLEICRGEAHTSFTVIA